jgi:CRISPR-associated protein Cas1
MMSLQDLDKKQLVSVFCNDGEKISFKNDNLVVCDKFGKLKLQITCYRILILFVVGGFTLTSGIIQKSHKFAFPIFLLTNSLKVYEKFGYKLQGNVILRRKQYEHQDDIELAKFFVKNKIKNQLYVLKSRRNKSEYIDITISKIQNYLQKLDVFKGNLYELLSIEANVAKIYFKAQFDNFQWQGRKPRVKLDYVNSCLDIGYSVLFNFIESMLEIFGFDVFCGVLHKEFYMRKSLVCDFVEPFRSIIDIQVRKSINLRQFVEEDFTKVNMSYQLKWTQNKKYTQIFLAAILKYKKEIFLFTQSYYRSFMKGKDPALYNIFSLDNK